MTDYDSYRLWLARRRAGEPAEGFADRVMERVGEPPEREPRAVLPLASRLCEWISRRPAAQAAALAAAALLGVLRLFATVQFLFSS